MSTWNAQTEQQLRQGFKSFNPFMLTLWRLGLGSWLNLWPEVGGRIMVLTHIGRKTGVRRRTPVNYAEIDGDLYCTAGFGQISDWYRNIRANPQVEVWLPNGWWAGVVKEITGQPGALAIMRQVLINSGFAAHAAGINPVTMSDSDLQAATASYRLLHIQRTAACTGQGGPGELAWIWPLATLILFVGLILPKKRKQS